MKALDTPGSPNRSAHLGARKAARILTQTRRLAADFLGVSDPQNLILVSGATFGINLVAQGLASYATYSSNLCDTLPVELCVAYSEAEHNAVTRSIHHLAGSNEIHCNDRNKAKYELIEIGLKSTGQVCIEKLRELLDCKKIHALFIQHASNITGAINPIKTIASMCKEKDTLLIVDGSQSAGHMPIHLDELSAAGLSAWTCSGHKGLLGPAGSGLLYLSPDFKPLPLIFGGTGGGEHDYLAHDVNSILRPYDYEAGTPALPAIAGLGAGIKAVQDSFEKDSRSIEKLTQFIVPRLKEIEGLHILGESCADSPNAGSVQNFADSTCSDDKRRIPLASLSFDRNSSEQMAFILDAQFGIAARAGLHCSPLTHRTMGTYPDGALRISWNASNSIEELEKTIIALQSAIGMMRG